MQGIKDGMQELEGAVVEEDKESLGVVISSTLRSYVLPHLLVSAIPHLSNEGNVTSLPDRVLPSTGSAARCGPCPGGVSVWAKTKGKE